MTTLFVFLYVLSLRLSGKARYHTYFLKGEQRDRAVASGENCGVCSLIALVDFLELHACYNHSITISSWAMLRWARFDRSSHCVSLSTICLCHWWSSFPSLGPSNTKHDEPTSETCVSCRWRWEEKYEKHIFSSFVISRADKTHIRCVATWVERREIQAFHRINLQMSETRKT